MMREDWVEIKYKDAVDKVSTSKQKIKQKEYLPKGLYPVIDQGHELVGGYTNDKSKLLDCKLPAIVFGDHTKIVKLINFQFVPGADGTKVLEPKKFILPKYLSFLTPILVHKIKDKGYARHYQHIEKQNFPLPPLPEQRAIVAKIEKLFSDLDNGIANLKAAKAKLDIYRQVVLKKAFEGELTKEWRESYKGQTASDLFKKIKIKREELFTQQYNDWIIKYEEKNASEKKNPAKPKKPVFGVRLTDNEFQNMPNSPKSWHILRFIDLIKYEDNGIKRGPFGSAIKKGFFVPSGFKVYEQQNAIKRDSTLGTYYIDEKKYKELEKFSVKGGDYIVSCSGTIGRIHKLDYDCEPGVINQALLKIVLDEQLIHSKYFLYLFRSEVFQRKILKGTRGTGMQNLASVDEIKQIPIQLPSINEQLQIVQEIESRLSVCDKLAESVDQSLEKAEALRQSILKKAFSGHLLDEAELAACRREPDWEPADKLLERIKKDKAVGAQNATTGKARKVNNA